MHGSHFVRFGKMKVLPKSRMSLDLIKKSLGLSVSGEYTRRIAQVATSPLSACYKSQYQVASLVPDFLTNCSNLLPCCSQVV